MWQNVTGISPKASVYYLLCHLDLQRASVRIEKCHFFFNRQMWFITQSVEWARQNYSPTFPLRGLARPKSLFWLEAFSLVSVLLNPILFVFRMAKLSVSRENVFCCRPKWKKHDRDVSKTLMPAVTTSNYVRLRIFLFLLYIYDASRWWCCGPLAWLVSGQYGIGSDSVTVWMRMVVCLHRCPTNDWRSVRSVICRQPKISWDRLHPPATLLRIRRVENGWMDG